MRESELETLRTRVYRWAYRLVQNHEDALDVTQGVLVRRLQAGAPHPAKQLAWLRRVTFNLSIDTIRRRRPTLALNTCDSADPGGRHIADTLEQGEQREQIMAALEVLSEVQRQVLLAKTFDGQTFAAIAEDLGLGISTVKTHYIRALAKMRDALARTDSDLRGIQ